MASSSSPADGLDSSLPSPVTLTFRRVADADASSPITPQFKFKPVRSVPNHKPMPHPLSSKPAPLASGRELTDVLPRLPTTLTFTNDPSNIPIQTPSAIINSVRSETAIIRQMQEMLQQKKSDSQNYLAQLLIIACRINSDIDYSSAIVALLEKQIDINIKDPNGNTPLMYACRRGKLNIVKILLDKGANIEIANSKGFTALHFAAHYGYLDIVNVLIAGGAEVNVESEGHTMPLNHAAFSGNPDIVKILLDNGAKIDSIDQHGQTPLHVASLNDMLDVVRIFLDKGVDIDAKDKNGYTSLHFACCAGSPEIVNILLSKGAKVKNDSIHGLTVLHFAASISTAITLINDQAVVASSDDRRSEVVKILLNNGIDVDVKDEDGFTPLHIAALRNNFGFVNILLDNGANIDAEANDGSTALHCSTENNSPETLKVLLDRKAKIDAKNKLGHTPLHVAALRGKLEIVNTLITEGAKADAQDESGWTPLCCAVKCSHIEVVRALINEKVEIDVKMKEGFTPLHLAVYNDRPEIVELLISAGADIDVAGPGNAKPIYIAVSRNSFKIAELLLDKGCKITEDVLDAIMSIKEPTEIQKTLIMLCRVIYKCQSGSNGSNKPVSTAVNGAIDDKEPGNAKRTQKEIGDDDDTTEVDNSNDNAFLHLNKKLGTIPAICNGDSIPDIRVSETTMTRWPMETSTDLDNM